MATQYEVEHNVQFAETQPRSRRVNMDSFFSLLNRVSDSGTATPHNNPHATPTLPDMANIFRLLQDQMQTLASTAPTAENRTFLMDLVDTLDGDILDPPDRLRGVGQEFLDALDRVGRKTLRADDDCAICKIPYLEDPYCLVVELPCKGAHRFDLECVGPWLRSKGTCPMCREEMGKKKVAAVQEDEDEDEDDMDMIYA
ncbi:RING finger domain protein [Metarhizium robertsii]|uniref:Zinc finger domain-containing protein, RING-type n=2 Tax=Metarhizium robertsii TaxID=568076 RepID=E9EQT9_METRA|nr:Zinc finger domain-containing protein, RING-type [Metarhizium robertsii ARSEF 23]EFZ02595.2 Zinc finger domain-containing protein, RING-type [Metarhizium robertsii ARSEF 23]EXV05803.1 RING finger domain protein [Metarhizium robertsii]